MLLCISVRPRCSGDVWSDVKAEVRCNSQRLLLPCILSLAREWSLRLKLEQVQDLIRVKQTVGFGRKAVTGCRSH